VTLEARAVGAGINESYQTAGRVESYVATQDLVVPKDALFGKIIEVLMKEMAPARRSIRILEPGMGPAAFTRFVLRRPFLDRFDDIHVQGADLSHGRLVYATGLCRAVRRRERLLHDASFDRNASGLLSHVGLQEELTRDRQHCGADRQCRGASLHQESVV